jgi:hypothetical protein
MFFNPLLLGLLSLSAALPSSEARPKLHTRDEHEGLPVVKLGYASYQATSYDYLNDVRSWRTTEEMPREREMLMTRPRSTFGATSDLRHHQQGL